MYCLFRYVLPLRTDLLRARGRRMIYFICTLVSPTSFPNPSSTFVIAHLLLAITLRQMSCTIRFFIIKSKTKFSIALHKGKHSWTFPISYFVSYNHLLSSTHSFIASLKSISITKTVNETLSHPSWRNTVIEKMKALDDNGTQDLVSRPVAKKAIGCKWLFAFKVNLDDSEPIDL